LGLSLSEKQIPQVVVNVANSKHRMERLEWLGVLAKQAYCMKLMEAYKQFRAFRRLRSKPYEGFRAPTTELAELKLKSSRVSGPPICCVS
jgi:hypothetical protein